MESIKKTISLGKSINLFYKKYSIVLFKNLLTLKLSCSFLTKIRLSIRLFLKLWSKSFLKFLLESSKLLNPRDQIWMTWSFQVYKGEKVRSKWRETYPWLSWFSVLLTKLWSSGQKCLLTDPVIIRKGICMTFENIKQKCRRSVN